MKLFDPLFKWIGSKIGHLFYMGPVDKQRNMKMELIGDEGFSKKLRLEYRTPPSKIEVYVISFSTCAIFDLTKEQAIQVRDFIDKNLENFDDSKIEPR